MVNAIAGKADDIEPHEPMGVFRVLGNIAKRSLNNFLLLGRRYSQLRRPDGSMQACFYLCKDQHISLQHNQVDFAVGRAVTLLKAGHPIFAQIFFCSCFALKTSEIGRSL